MQSHSTLSLIFIHNVTMTFVTTIIVAIIVVIFISLMATFYFVMIYIFIYIHFIYSCIWWCYLCINVINIYRFTFIISIYFHFCTILFFWISYILRVDLLTLSLQIIHLIVCFSNIGKCLIDGVQQWRFLSYLITWLFRKAEKGVLWWCQIGK